MDSNLGCEPVYRLVCILIHRGKQLQRNQQHTPYQYIQYIFCSGEYKKGDNEIIR